MVEVKLKGYILPVTSTRALVNKIMASLQYECLISHCHMKSHTLQRLFSRMTQSHVMALTLATCDEHTSVSGKSFINS